MLAQLELRYRVVEMCSGYVGHPAASTFAPGFYGPCCTQMLEVSSVSRFSDYQARRANIRYRPEAEKGTAMLHTLNGSALAVPRVWAALVETNRLPDGSVSVPDALRRYMGGREVIGQRRHGLRPEQDLTSSS